jgi:3-oxoacyl-[acyl-carrier protein] reductase
MAQKFSALKRICQILKAREAIFKHVVNELGSVSALILSHCRSIDLSIETTTVEEFDLHFALNARAVWLLVREFARQFTGEFGSGRIISITSDHVAFNLPYVASKGAMDRIVLAAAEEYRLKGITANLINPGATDTGWMDENFKNEISKKTFLNRVGKPQDCANLVTFLCSPQGGWINGQLLYSDGGIH